MRTPTLHLTTRRVARLLGAGLAAGLGTVSIAVLSAQVAEAVPQLPPVQVTNCHASGHGSLVNAVSSAPSGATVVFATSCQGRNTIVPGATITIASNLTIRGLGPLLDAVSGANSYGVFAVNAGVTATLSGITIENGNAYLGGGLANSGTLTITDSIVSGNSAEFGGGGISNGGSLSVSISTLSDNSAGTGAGIFQVAGPPSEVANINDSLLTGNSTGEGGIGGGITVLGGVLKVANSVLLGNSAPGGYGGGIFDENAMVTVDVTDSVLSGNHAVNGGGIYNGNFATVNVIRTLALGNSATTGSALDQNGSTTTVTSSVFFANHDSSVDSPPGVFQSGGTFTESHSTFS